VKRATLERVRLHVSRALYESDRVLYQDILDSDARQRARIRDLEARLRAAHDCWFGTFPEQGEDWDEALKRVTDLKNKKWRP
jgi:hypothetical protein